MLTEGVDVLRKALLAKQIADGATVADVPETRSDVGLQPPDTAAPHDTSGTPKNMHGGCNTPEQSSAAKDQPGPGLGFEHPRAPDSVVQVRKPRGQPGKDWSIQVEMGLAGSTKNKQKYSQLLVRTIKVNKACVMTALTLARHLGTLT